MSESESGCLFCDGREKDIDVTDCTRYLSESQNVFVLIAEDICLNLNRDFFVICDGREKDIDVTDCTSVCQTSDKLSPDFFSCCLTLR